jgi:hypothetical protein
MRYRGGGVGHKATREATRCVYEDRDPLDKAGADTMQDDTNSGDEDTNMDTDGDSMHSWSDVDESDDDGSIDDHSNGELLDEYEAEGFAEF